MAFQVEDLDLKINSDSFPLALLTAEETEEDYSFVFFEELQGDERDKMGALLTALGVTNFEGKKVLTIDQNSGSIYGFATWNLEGIPCLCSGGFDEDSIIIPLEFRKEGSWQIYANGVKLGLSSTQIKKKSDDNRVIEYQQPILDLVQNDLEFEDTKIEFFSAHFLMSMTSVKTEGGLKQYTFNSLLKTLQAKKEDTVEVVQERVAKLLRKPPSGGGFPVPLYTVVYPYALKGLPCPVIELPILAIEEKPEYEANGNTIAAGLILTIDTSYLPSSPSVNKKGDVFDSFDRLQIEANQNPAYSILSPLIQDEALIPSHNKGAVQMLKNKLSEGELTLKIVDYNYDKKGRRYVPSSYPNHKILFRKAENFSDKISALSSGDFAALPASNPSQQTIDEPEAITVSASVVPSVPTSRKSYDDIPF